MTQTLGTCDNCGNYIDALACLAFPDGIPEDILDGTFDHTEPHEGDSGIRYEARS